LEVVDLLLFAGVLLYRKHYLLGGGGVSDRIVGSVRSGAYFEAKVGPVADLDLTFKDGAPRRARGARDRF